MTEKLIHYIWQQRLFYPEGMLTTTGEKVEVVNPGRLNTDAGPDFFNAQLRVDDILWAGNVEIHLDADDWYVHHHDQDAAYDNVVLHVVLSPGIRPTITSKGRVVPEVVLRFPADISDRYDQLMRNSDVIRCASSVGQIAPVDRDSWLDRLVLERFEERNERVERLLSLFGGDIDQTFFALLCRAMGFVVNSEPMERLAQITPVKILIKHDDPLQREALLLGQAGFLDSVDEPDEYTSLLKREYDFLRVKFSLSPMDSSEWKLLRLRPDNFPVIRLSQLASVIALTPGNFENAFRSMDVADLMRSLDVSASSYWDSHYALGRQSKTSRAKRLGLQAKRLVIVNAVIPFLFAYARRFGSEKEQMNVVNMLSFLPIESNSRLDQWKACGIVPQNESEAQALLLLYKNYCQPRKCLLCRWGHRLLSTSAKQ